MFWEWKCLEITLAPFILFVPRSRHAGIFIIHRKVRWEAVWAIYGLTTLDCISGSCGSNMVDLQHAGRKSAVVRSCNGENGIKWGAKLAYPPCSNPLVHLGSLLRLGADEAKQWD